ncbi:MAG: hypothetical protein ACP5N3_03315 [Candidatus Nanoarchaeia archaeon]
MPYYAPTNAQQQNSPTELIKTLRMQGMDNNQIIQTLQKQGFSSNVIFDAMNQVDITPKEDEYQDFSPATTGMSMPKMQKAIMPAPNTTDEELIEAIIEEKWSGLVKDLDKLIEWKNTTTSKVAAMEQKMEDMRHEFDKLHSAIIAKIDDYDKNISNVGAEVRAMEKAFSKVLPVFAENVAELSRISKDLKRPPVRPATK